jgi:hypothetical protein
LTVQIFHSRTGEIFAYNSVPSHSVEKQTIRVKTMMKDTLKLPI